jgi:hypothetical protein
MKKMRTTRKISVIVFIAVLAIMMTKADGSRDLHDPRVDGWYEVSDWELDVCSKWGGTGRAQSSHISQEGETRLSQLEVTLQAFRAEYEGSTLYEVAWYIKPFSGEEEYTVIMDGEKELEIYSGSATSTAGDNGYDARHINASFDSVEIRYDSGRLVVPIVEKQR